MAKRNRGRRSQGKATTRPIDLRLDSSGLAELALRESNKHRGYARARGAVEPGTSTTDWAKGRGEHRLKAKLEAEYERQEERTRRLVELTGPSQVRLRRACRNSSCPERGKVTRRIHCTTCGSLTEAGGE